MKRTRWAMVGTGLMPKLIGGDLGITENIEARVIVSRSRQKAEAAAREHGFAEGSDDFEATIRRDDIDVVYIATPHSEHHRQAIAALRAGKHVLVEKPMTTSARDTEELCSLARRLGLFAMEAMWTAFNPAIIELRRRVAAGAIGDVRLLHAEFNMALPYDPASRMWAPHLAGGSTWDQGVYTLSFAHMLFGEPVSIRAQGTVTAGVDAEVVATLDFAGGQRAVCVNGLRAHTPLLAYIAGTKGYLQIDPPFWATSGFKQVMTSGPFSADVETFSVVREGGGYVPMLRAVSTAVQQGQTEHSLRTHADSHAVAKSMDEVLRQVLSGSTARS
jgi:predicted dehydrogenase